MALGNVTTGGSAHTGAEINPARFIKNLGTVALRSAGNANLSFTIPSGGVPAGHTVIISLVNDYAAGSIPLPVDSKNNVWFRDKSTTNASPGPQTSRITIFSAYIGQALASGDTITIQVSPTAKVAVYDEWDGLQAGVLDTSFGTFGIDNAPNTAGAPTTLYAGDIVYGTLSLQWDATETVTEALNWIRTGNISTSGGTGPDKNQQNNTAYLRLNQLLSPTYAPTIVNARNWTAQLAAYKPIAKGLGIKIKLPARTSAGQATCSSSRLSFLLKSTTSAGHSAAVAVTFKKVLPASITHGVVTTFAQPINRKILSTASVTQGRATTSSRALVKKLPARSVHGNGFAIGNTTKRRFPLVSTAGRATTSKKSVSPTFKFLPISVAAHAVANSSVLNILAPPPPPPPALIKYISREVPGLEARIFYNGLVLNDKSQGEYYRILDMDGMADADIRDSRDLHSNRDGEEAYDALVGGRTITLTGEICAFNLRRLREMQQQLRSAFASLYDYDLVFKTNDNTGFFDLRIACRKTAALVGAETQDVDYFKRPFLITLRASDPRFTSVYEQVQTIDSSHSTISVINQGNYEAYPIFYVWGSIVRPTITNVTTNQTISLSATLNDNDFLIIDTFNRRIVDSSGLNKFGLIASNADGSPKVPSWITFKPGANTINFSSVARGAISKLEIRWKDSWV